MFDVESTGLMILYSVFYTFLSLYAIGSGKKSLRILSVWFKLCNQTKTLFKNYERRGNPKLNDRNLILEKFNIYRIMNYAGMAVSGAIMAIAIWQFVEVGFLEATTFHFNNWHLTTMLLLIGSISTSESIRTGAHCDITTIQYDLTVVMNHSNQK